MPQAIQQGRSIPKVVRVNADDGDAMLYRNLGNGRRLPFIWGTTVTLASGTSEVVVSSGVAFSGHTVAEGVINVTPLTASGGAMDYYIDKDATSNIVTLKASTASDDLTFDIMVMLGVGANPVSTDSNQIWKRSFSS